MGDLFGEQREDEVEIVDVDMGGLFGDDGDYWES